MSPRAAWRLANLGYPAVFDYVAGKADWLAYGLPWQGTAALISPYVSRDVDTCRPDESIASVRQRLAPAHGDMVIVVNDQDIVLGRLDPAAHDGQPDLAASQVMTEGPTTVRPSEEIDPLLERMAKANVNQIIVTHPDGRLDGLYHRPTVPERG
jgi:CBS domain-containing protein